MISRYDENCIQLTRKGAIAIVTLNKPERRNALDRRMRQEFFQTIHSLVADDLETRAIILTGKSGHFSAGADVSEMAKRPILATRQIVEETCAPVRDITGGAKPVIAAVEGIAFGMGLSLVVAADYVVGASNARYCAAFLRIGLIPDTGILWTLPRKIGMTKARELLSLAIEIDGNEAARIGLVDKVVEPGRALDAAITVAENLIKNPPLSMALTKAAHTFRTATVESTAGAEVDYVPMLARTNDFLEALSAGTEKREPLFKGS